MQTPKQVKEYLDEIDTRYREAKAKRISRFDPEWGIWSREMNLGVRARIEANNEETIFYKYLFIYWLLKSQLLELHFKSRLGKRGKKKKRAKEASDIRETILTGKLEGKEPFDNLKDFIAKKITE